MHEIKKPGETIYDINSLVIYVSSMYNIAKYGYQKIGAGPEKLYQKKEASLALAHAYEVFEKATMIYYDCSPIYFGKSAYVQTAPSPSFSL